MTPLRPITKAAPPALAEYSRASPGAPWLVSVPMATPRSIMRAPTRPRQVWIAAVPALQANSKSAAVRWGVAPTACHDRRRRLHRVGMGLGADIERPDRLRVDAAPLQRLAKCLGRDGDGVLVGRRDALLHDVEPLAHRGAIGSPDRANLGRGDSVFRDVGSVAHHASFHGISASYNRSNRVRISAGWREVVRRGIRSTSLSRTASGSTRPGSEKITADGLSGWARIATIGERPYVTCEKMSARWVVHPNTSE